MPRRLSPKNLTDRKLLRIFLVAVFVVGLAPVIGGASVQTVIAWALLAPTAGPAIVWAVWYWGREALREWIFRADMRAIEADPAFKIGPRPRPRAVDDVTPSLGLQMIKEDPS